MQSDDGSRSADDSFLDDRGYRSFCTSWYGGIATHDKEAKPFSLLRPPWFLRPFLMPIPGVPLALLVVVWLAILGPAIGRGTAGGSAP